MEVGFIGLTVAAFGILSDAAGKYTVAKVSMTTAALSLAYTCLEELTNAEASKAVSKVQKISGESAFSRFDKLAEKAERERAEAEAMASLDQPIPDAGDDVLNRYANGGGGATSAKLAELKARLGK